MASGRASPVGTRTACSTASTNILQSPILPVRAVLMIVSTTASAIAASTTISSLILGTKLTTYSAPDRFLYGRLGAKPLDLGDHQAVHVHRSQGLALVIQFGRFDCRYNQFQINSFLSRLARSRLSPNNNTQARFVKLLKEIF